MTAPQNQSTTTPSRPNALRLMRQVLGTPQEIAKKLEDLVRGAAAYVDIETLERRLEVLHQKNIIDEIPSPLQLIVGGVDMLRFWISPATDYYQQQGSNLAFQQLLRFFDDPRSMMNPVGLLNSQSAIIGHLMQVVHANPDYDLQLLEMFEDGVESLAYQLEQMLQGTHPRYHSISAMVEEPNYHLQLLVYVRAWQRGETSTSLRRQNIIENPELAETFGDLTHAMRYFVKLPKRPLPAVLHLLWNRSLNLE